MTHKAGRYRKLISPVLPALLRGQCKARSALWLAGAGILLHGTSCGSSAGGLIQQILCGRGDAKNKMTVGFDLGQLGELLNVRATAIPDEQIKSFLNDTLQSVNIDPEQFNVESVESVIPGDSVRFLDVGGNFSDLFGSGATLLKQAFSGGSLTDGGPLDFVSESFGVRAAEAQKIYYREKVRRLAKEYLPEALYRQVVNVETSPHPDQWAYKQTDYEDAIALFERMMAVKKRDISDEGEPVIVAVLDTGVNKNHPDLKDILVSGYNATDEGGKGDWDDENGHGTHCAGIIGARKTSDESPVGVATMANVRIMPIKVLGGSGSGGFQAIEKGIRYAMDKGAEVISMSLGAGLEYDDVAKQGGLANQVIADAVAKGIIVVIAAGNEACPLGGSCSQEGSLFSKSTFTEYTVVPCAYEGSLCIGATNADETLAEYSNYSSAKEADYRTKVDVNAPGSAIYSTWIDDGDEPPYKTISGTSMATPYVAGIAAILKSVDKTLKQKDVIALLKAGQAHPEAIEEKSEAGRVDLMAVLNQAARTRLKMDEPEYTAEDSPVDAPEMSEGAAGSIGDLWGSVCQ